MMTTMNTMRVPRKDGQFVLREHVAMFYHFNYHVFLELTSPDIPAYQIIPNHLHKLHDPFHISE
jgi:hypothetical protein